MKNTGSRFARSRVPMSSKLTYAWPWVRLASSEPSPICRRPGSSHTGKQPQLFRRSSEDGLESPVNSMSWQIETALWIRRWDYNTRRDHARRSGYNQCANGSDGVAVDRGGREGRRAQGVNFEFSEEQNLLREQAARLRNRGA